MKKPKVGQAVAYKGAAATITEVSHFRQRPDGTRFWWLWLSTHRGLVEVATDHPELHIP